MLKIIVAFYSSFAYNNIKRLNDYSTEQLMKGRVKYEYRESSNM